MKVFFLVIVLLFINFYKKMYIEKGKSILEKVGHKELMYVFFMFLMFLNEEANYIWIIVFLILLGVFMGYWLRDVVIEGTYLQKHTILTPKGLKIGIFLFIVCYITLLSSMICNIFSVFYDINLYGDVVAFDNSYCAMTGFGVISKFTSVSPLYTKRIIANCGFELTVKGKVFLVTHDSFNNINNFYYGSAVNNLLKYFAMYSHNKFHVGFSVKEFGAQSDCTDTMSKLLPYMSMHGANITSGLVVPFTGLANLQIPLAILKKHHLFAKDKLLTSDEFAVFDRDFRATKDIGVVYNKDFLVCNSIDKKLEKMDAMYTTIKDSGSVNMNDVLSYNDFRVIEQGIAPGGSTKGNKSFSSSIKGAGTGTLYNYNDENSALFLNTHCLINVISKDNLVNALSYNDVKPYISAKRLSTIEDSYRSVNAFIEKPIGLAVLDKAFKFPYMRIFVIADDLYTEANFNAIISHFSRYGNSAFFYKELSNNCDYNSIIYNQSRVSVGGMSDVFYNSDFSDDKYTTHLNNSLPVDLHAIINEIIKVKLP